MVKKWVGRLLILLGLMLLAIVLYRAMLSHRQYKVAQTFQRAEVAIQAGDVHVAQSYEQQLQGNPLYPYVVYDSLSTHLDTLPVEAVDQFLTQFADTPLAPKLRRSWLRVLAHHQQWPLFLQYYQPDSTIQCLYADALRHTGNVAEAYAFAKTLWMVPRPQPAECDDLFAAWVSSGELTPDMVWQRFMMVLQADDPRLANYLVGLLPTNMQTTARLWLKVRTKPDLILDTSIFPVNDSAQTPLILYGLKRWSQQDAPASAKAWTKLQTMHPFDLPQQQEATVAIAEGLIRQEPQSAPAWVAQIQSAYITPLVANYRLRYALIRQDWQQLLTWIQAMPMEMQQQLQWQYWYARALEQVGHAVEAHAIYQALAAQRHYYGFLAASRLQQPLMLAQKQRSISWEEKQQFLANPAIIRMRALYAINQSTLGNAEWWYAIAHMDPQQQYVAATIAAEWKMYNLSLLTAEQLPDKSDLILRFPQPYVKTVTRQAKTLGLDPAFIYAITRQESMFDPNAVSAVGAQGLMQLRPTTARMLAQQAKFSSLNDLDLTNPQLNIRLGSLYLSGLLKRNQDNPALAAAAYNAGPGRVPQWLPLEGEIDMDIWVDTIPYYETRNYVKNVLTYMMVYQRLQARDPTLVQVLIPIKSNK